MGPKLVPAAASPAQIGASRAQQRRPIPPVTPVAPALAVWWCRRGTRWRVAPLAAPLRLLPARGDDVFAER
jgi:hypothetical protein